MNGGVFIGTVSVLCQEHVIKFVSTTSPTKCKFMEKVVTANMALAEGYNRLDRSDQK